MFAVERWGVERAARGLRAARACGLDGVPAEFWKTLLAEPGSANAWPVSFGTSCWRRKAESADWRRVQVAPIFKKAGRKDCDSCRPISVLQTGRGFFACVQLGRLKDAGAEQGLGRSLFGRATAPRTP